MARVLGHTFSYSERSEKPREVCNLITRDARVPRVVLATGRPIYTCIYRNGVRSDVIYSVWQVVDILLSNAWADQCGNEDILARNISLPYAPKEKFIFIIQHKLCKRSWFSKPEVTSRHMKPAPLIHTIDSHSETHIRYLLALSNANCNARRASPQTSLLPGFFLTYSRFRVLRNSALIVEISVAEAAEVTFDQISFCVNEEKQEEVTINNHLPTYLTFRQSRLQNQGSHWKNSAVKWNEKRKLKPYYYHSSSFIIIIKIISLSLPLVT